MNTYSINGRLERYFEEIETQKAIIQKAKDRIEQMQDELLEKIKRGVLNDNWIHYKSYENNFYAYVSSSVLNSDGSIKINCKKFILMKEEDELVILPSGTHTTIWIDGLRIVSYKEVETTITNLLKKGIY